MKKGLATISITGRNNRIQITRSSEIQIESHQDRQQRRRTVLNLLCDNASNQCRRRAIFDTDRGERAGESRISIEHNDPVARRAAGQLYWTGC